MAQARRIKPKKTAKQPIALRRYDVPWGLLIVIATCLCVLGYLFYGMQTGNPKLGAGINYWLSKSNAEPEFDPEITQHIESRSVEKDFGFYELLKNMDQVMPDDLPDSEPARPDEKVHYFIQAASFKSHADAEKLRVQIAAKGYKSITQAREVKGKGLYYRVRLGPYSDRRKAKTVKNKLEKIGVKAYYYKVNK